MNAIIQPRENCKTLTFRMAQMEDAELLLEWRNEEQTRLNSLTTDMVTMENHLKWLRAKQPTISIGMLDGVPVGQVRVNLDYIGHPNLHVEHVLSFSVDHRYRNQGFGRQLVLSQMWQRPLLAQVKPENAPSLRVFERLNWSRSEVNGLVEFRHVPAR